MSLSAKKLQKKLSRLIKNGLAVSLVNEINDSAGHIINDIAKRVGRKVDIDGQSFTPLLEATIKQKRTDPEAVGQFASYPLIRTGAMTGALGFGGSYLKTKATASNQEAIISAPNVKAPYGIYHQDGGSSLPKRKWFGISMEAEREILKNMKRRIKRLLAK
jgi:phage gpG-like protein